MSSDLHEQLAAAIYRAMARSNGRGRDWSEAVLPDRTWCLRLAAEQVPLVESMIKRSLDA
jgi:hypothetical protein